ncbi:MAG: BatD family protein [Gammaproteobacteria bacterium]|nr:BatD family protein [Gammaproteobacteria bacterium]
MVKWLWLCLLLPALAAGAEPRLSASVDRDRVPANESVTLTVRLLGEPVEVPDWSVLDEHFETLHRGQESRVRIIDGDYARETLWEVGLMPRNAGVREVPAIGVGSSLTDPIPLVVMPPAEGSQRAGDIFVEASVSSLTPYVQAEVIYTVRLYLAVGARGTRLSEPRASRGEVMIQKLGEARQFQAVRDGRNFLVWEQRYSLVPQRSGALVIDAMTLEAQLSEGGRRPRVSRFRSEPLELDVRPMPARPDAIPEGPWLPARALSLDLAAALGNQLRAGEPVTATLTLTASGLRASQLPTLELTAPEGLRIYSDRADLSDDAQREGGSRARRVQQLALIATQPGRYPPLAISVPWFNVETERWEVARAELPGLEVIEAQSAPPGLVAADAQGLERSGSAALSGAARPWQLATLGLGVAWLLTLLAWWRLGNFGRHVAAGQRRLTGAPGASQRMRSIRSALRALKLACRRNDAAGARDALLDWARCEWPEHPPRSVGAVAERLPAQLAEPVRALSAVFYSPVQTPWSGAGLAARIDDFRRLPSQQAEPDDGPLPGLWPR